MPFLRIDGRPSTTRQRFCWALIAFFTCVLGYSTAGAQPDSHTVAPAPYFYVVAADPQLLFKQKDDRNWKTTIRHLNRLKPDFVVVCGDLIQGPNEAPAWDRALGDFEELARMYLDGVSQLDRSIRLHNVAGNHDVSIRPTARRIAWYEQKFGKAWYSFEHKRSLFIVLESNLLRDASGAPDLGKKQMQWLLETLEDSRGKDHIHKTAYMHHPLCIESVNEKSQYFNIHRERREELLKLFHEHGFKAVFCGHYHRNAYVRDGDLELITTSSCGAALGKDPLGFRIVKVYGDRIEHRYYAFDKLPERVKLDPPKPQETPRRRMRF